MLRAVEVSPVREQPGVVQATASFSVRDFAAVQFSAQAELAGPVQAHTSLSLKCHALTIVLKPLKCHALSLTSNAISQLSKLDEEEVSPGGRSTLKGESLERHSIHSIHSIHLSNFENFIVFIV